MATKKEHIVIVLNGQSTKVALTRKEDGSLPSVTEAVATVAEALGIPANVSYCFNGMEISENTPAVPGGTVTCKTKSAEKN